MTLFSFEKLKSLNLYAVLLLILIFILIIDNITELRTSTEKKVHLIAIINIVMGSICLFLTGFVYMYYKRQKENGELDDKNIE